MEPLHEQARYFLDEIGGGLPSLLATLIHRSGAQAKQSEEAAAEKERREEEAENADAASSVSWGWAVMKKIVNGEEIVFTCLVSPDPCIRHFDSKCHTSIKKVFT